MAVDKTWHILYVEDDEEQQELVKDYLNGEVIEGAEGSLQVDCEGDFSKALLRLEEGSYDILILDLMLGNQVVEPSNHAGARTLEQIKRELFVPVIYFTAIPSEVQEEESGLVKIVNKTETRQGLLNAITEIVQTHLPEVSKTFRILMDHLREVQQKYMWDFVKNNWEKFGSNEDRMTVAYLLARRMAIELNTQSIDKLSQALGGPEGQGVKEDKIHPMQYYILPFLSLDPIAGDLFKDKKGNYWVLLTPSCDLVNGRVKADNVLLAKCVPLEDIPEFTKWKAANFKNAGLRSSFLDIIKNTKKDRYFFLPSALNLPDQLVDFQKLISMRFETLNGKMERIASLDSPYAEAILARFSRYFGRLGIPDLDTDFVEKIITLKYTVIPS